MNTMNTMNVSNISYAVARAAELARESGEIQYVGFWREKNTFCLAQSGSALHASLEWWAACDCDGLVAFNDEDDYAQWALSLEDAYQSHIAAVLRSGDLAYTDDDGVEFVEV